MTPDNTRDLIAEAEKHQELVVCGNAQHTNFDVGCPDCAVVCDYCTCPWPCDARKCADALAVLTAAGVAPQGPQALDPEKVAAVVRDELRKGEYASTPGELPYAATSERIARALYVAYTEGKLTA